MLSLELFVDLYAFSDLTQEEWRKCIFHVLFCTIDFVIIGVEADRINLLHPFVFSKSPTIEPVKLTFIPLCRNFTMWMKFILEHYVFR